MHSTVSYFFSFCYFFCSTFQRLSTPRDSFLLLFSSTFCIIIASCTLCRVFTPGENFQVLNFKSADIRTILWLICYLLSIVISFSNFFCIMKNTFFTQISVSRIFLSLRLLLSTWLLIIRECFFSSKTFFLSSDLAFFRKLPLPRALE